MIRVRIIASIIGNDSAEVDVGIESHTTKPIINALNENKHLVFNENFILKPAFDVVTPIESVKQNNSARPRKD